MNKIYKTIKVVSSFAVLLTMLVSCESAPFYEDLSIPSEVFATNFTVSTDEAIVIANDALAMFDRSVGVKSKVRKVASIRSNRRKMDSRNVASSVSGSFYIINYEGGGYAVVSADKRATDVYAMSDEGCFDENANAGVVLFMAAAEEYQKEEISRNSVSVGGIFRPDSFVSKDDMNPGLEVEEDGVYYSVLYEYEYKDVPFCLPTTVWSQGAPYNGRCPVVDGEIAAAGCLCHSHGTNNGLS